MYSTSPLIKRSIPLVKLCKEQNISIDLLLTTIRLIDRGLLKSRRDIDKYLTMRSQRSVFYQTQAEKVKRLIVEAFGDLVT